MTIRQPAARCFKCTAKLGRERYTVRFPADDDRQGEADLCGRCIDALKAFLKGTTS